MFKRAPNKHQMCPYCGGMHAPGQCPMFMAPAMPPMYGGMMGGMMDGMVGGMMEGMMPMMHEMHQTMMQHTQMLQHISHRVDQIYDMCVAMQTGKAKG